MGISMAECGAGGGLVLVQRKNGTWRPGKVVGSGEFSGVYRSKNGGIPVKLLSKSDSSVDFFNLEKSSRIKAFRCGEFDDCIAKAESSQGHCKRSLKYVYRADAILDALRLEKQEVMKTRKRQGEELQGAVCRAKRSRRVYLPNKSSNCSSTISDHQSSILHPHVIVSESPVQSGSSGRNTSSRSRVCKSFAEKEESVKKASGQTEMRNPRDKEQSVRNYSSEFLPKDQTARLFKVQKWNVQEAKMKVHISRKLPVAVNSRKHTRKDLLVKCSSKVQGKTKSTAKLRKNLVGEVNRQSQSALQGHGSLNSRETVLIDVEVAIETRYRGKHVPWVSLMSRLNGRAIIGHPIEIEISDISSSDINLVGLTFDDSGSMKHQPVWRTSRRRTPVSYVPLPHKPVENISPHETEFLLKPLKKRELPNEYRVSGAHFKSPLQSCMKKDGFVKSSEKSKSTTQVPCVPLKIVYSKLYEAFGCCNLEE